VRSSNGWKSATQQHPHCTLNTRQTSSRNMLPTPSADGSWYTSSFPPIASADLLDEPNGSLIFQVASPTVLLVIALVLGIAANGWIQRMLSGDQGLGSFLSDGSGFNKSGFKPVTGDEDRAVSSGDPLPWLRLPKLDYVDVAGQEEDFEKGRLSNSSRNDDQALMVKLERLREEMNEKLGQGNVIEAEALRKEIEQTMKENGVQYFKD